MNKGKIIGYIGVVLIIIIIAFLGIRYYLNISSRGKANDNISTEIIKYSNLICNKSVYTDDYLQYNVITMAFDKDTLIWLRDVSVYYYFDYTKYSSAKSKLNATDDEVFSGTYLDDNYTITTTYDGKINDLSNSGWSINTDSYTYDDIIKYYQDEKYSCEEKN
jgi:hypothetical protein